MDETERTNQETEPIMPKPPKPPPGRMPIDYYNQSIDGKDALAFEPPPMPAAPTTGDPNLMRLYVPSENTELDFGAGRTPGIRMATDRHVHLTARTPRTTISLGSPGGDGINDPAMGVQVYTQGEKRETIDGSTEENYKNNKTEYVKGVWNVRCEDNKSEYVKGVWNQTCDNAKTETIAGTVTEHYKAEHNLTVGKQAVHRFEAGKVDSVGNDWVVDVKGHKTERVHGDNKNVTVGKQNTLFVGEKLAVSVGANAAIHVGGTYSASLADQRSALTGNKWEMVNGTAVGINLATKVTKDNVTVSTCVASYSNKGRVLEKGDLAVLRRTNQITSAAMIIFK